VKTVFATFNFRNPDLVIADKQYIETHVPLTLQLPNLRQYITGVILPDPPRQLAHRAAFNYFDDDAAMRWALHGSPAAKSLLQDGAAHLRVTRWLELDSEIIVPFEPRWPGLQCFVLATEFELKLNGSDMDNAERRYLNYHVNLIRRLPNLRHYMISKYRISRKTEIAGTGKERLRNPLRMSMLVFESLEAMRDAYQSPIGLELTRNEEATIANARAYQADATVQL
jgi:hypothetical protein